jgi:hypothetical protein
MAQKKIGLILLIFILLLSCATKTTITTPDQGVYIVQSKHDALVTLKEGDIEMVVDNRGKPSALMQILSMLFVRAPEAIDAD